MSNKNLTKEQDKAFKIFTDFVMKVVNITDTLHTTPKEIPDQLIIRDKALKELSEVLFNNYNWSKVLNKDELNNLVKQMKARIN